MKKVSLNAVARTVALLDNPAARNEDVVSVKATLGALGRYLRSMSTDEAIAVLVALVARAGRSKPVR